MPQRRWKEIKNLDAEIWGSSYLETLLANPSASR